MDSQPEFTSIDLLKDALGRLGYAYQAFLLGGEKFSRFTSNEGRVWLTADEHIHYPLASSSAREISKQKDMAHDLAQELQVAIPKTIKIDRESAATVDLETLLRSSSLIVKPSNASLSRGLTLDVKDQETARTAIEHAFEFSDKVLVQEQIEGEEVRFVVVNGVVKAALLRQTPRLIGDGKQTLSALLAAENEARAGLVLPYLQYPQLTSLLLPLASYDLSSIPANDEIIELGKSTMIRGGASVYNVIEAVHPTYIKTVEVLGQAMGNGFLVVDMIIKNYQTVQTSDNYAFIEFNMAPVLKLFYSCRDGKQYDVLGDLIPMIDASLHAGEML